MIYGKMLLYYSIFASAVLIYGIGLSRMVELPVTKLRNPLFYVKAMVSILSTSVLSCIVTRNILMPLGIIELFPFIAFLIFIGINAFLESLVRITTGTSTVEFSVSFIIVILSILESASILDSLMICFSCFLSLLTITPLCLIFKKRFCSNGTKLSDSFFSVFLIFLGCIILLLSIWDIGWLNKGVLK